MTAPGILRGPRGGPRPTLRPKFRSLLCICTLDGLSACPSPSPTPGSNLILSPLGLVPLASVYPCTCHFCSLAVYPQWARLGPVFYTVPPSFLNKRPLILLFCILAPKLWTQSADLLTLARWIGLRRSRSESDQGGGRWGRRRVLRAGDVWQLRKGGDCPQSHGNARLSAYCVPVRVAARAGLLQTEAPFFQDFPRRVFISRTKPGGPAASRAGVERKPGRRRAEEGRPPGGRRPCPAWVAGLRELKGPLCSVPRLPAGQERISSAAPDPGGSAAPLGTDTNSSRPSCRPVALGTKLNRLTSPGRCVATGIDSPSGPPPPPPRC